MFRIQFKGGRATADKIREKLRRTPRNVKGRLKEVVNEIIRYLKIPGKPPTYPIQWDSEKQRRAFFATNGFGGGIPHKRTGKTASGWKIEEVKSGFTVRNNFKGAIPVWGTPTGQDQSNIHVGRWALLGDIMQRVIKRLPKIIKESLKETS